MGKSTNPYWYKLIKLFKSDSVEKDYRMVTGPTIPFLFGAYKLLGEPFDDIYSLLDAINEATEINVFPIIQRCPGIGQHVIAVVDKAKFRKDKDFKSYINIASCEREGALKVSNNTQIGKTISTISQSMILEYQEWISKEKYSRSNGEWRKFDEKEIELIKSIK